MLFSKEFYLLNGITNILTDDLNSIFLRILRTKRGLVYYFESNLELDEVNKGYSFLELSTLIDTDNLLELLKVIFDIIKCLKKNLINNKYFKNYKSKNKIQYMKDMFTFNPTQFLSSYSHYYLWDKPIIKYKDEIKLYNQLTPELFKKYCVEIFNKKNMVLCYDGNKKLNKHIEKILDNFD